MDPILELLTENPSFMLTNGLILLCKFDLSETDQSEWRFLTVYWKFFSVGPGCIINHRLWVPVCTCLPQFPFDHTFLLKPASFSGHTCRKLHQKSMLICIHPEKLTVERQIRVLKIWSSLEYWNGGQWGIEAYGPKTIKAAVGKKRNLWVPGLHRWGGAGY